MKHQVYIIGMYRNRAVATVAAACQRIQQSEEWFHLGCVGSAKQS